MYHLLFKIPLINFSQRIQKLSSTAIISISLFFSFLLVLVIHVPEILIINMMTQAGVITHIKKDGLKLSSASLLSCPHLFRLSRIMCYTFKGSPTCDSKPQSETMISCPIFIWSPCWLCVTYSLFVQCYRNRWQCFSG